ncbi:MAG TPA: LacI family DNA-binding transcriptional regulator [Vicinamibacterales bacterium]|nr:LacI family DNA-binding transcriptional regulator [Vicinamibacterales bacterium]
MPNIYEVARRAGVSTATVSRVLSQPDVVAPDTRRRVMAAVERLGYTPNASATNLRTLRTRKLLVTVPDISNPFFSLILQGIEDTAQRAGYSVLLGDTQHDEQREERYALMLRRKEADGLIFLGHRVPEEAAALVRTLPPGRAPIVNGCEFSPRLGIPSVHIDNATAASDAMDHLYRLGHRRIGIVTGPLVSPLSRDRLHGATARAKKAGAERDFIVMNGDFSIESGAVAGERLLERKHPPTAIFCFNDEMAMGVLETARRRKLRVPDDLSIVGFDDIRFARYLDPPLTTIAQPMRQIGEGTVKLLLQILQGEGAPESVTLPHVVVVRSSTAPPPGTRAAATRPRRSRRS